jgi:hypothetical protein
MNEPAQSITIRRSLTTRIFCVIALAGAIEAGREYFALGDYSDAFAALGLCVLLVVYLAVKPMLKQISAARQWTPGPGHSKWAARFLLIIGPTGLFTFFLSDWFQPRLIPVLCITAAVFSLALFWYEQSLSIEVRSDGMRRVQALSAESGRVIAWDSPEGHKPGALWLFIKVWGEPNTFAFDTTSYRIPSGAASVILKRAKFDGMNVYLPD